MLQECVQPLTHVLVMSISRDLAIFSNSVERKKAEKFVGSKSTRFSFYKHQ